ncbi:MAG: ABC transporter substrate-binding protein [Acidimicrobiia bacterium]
MKVFTRTTASGVAVILAVVGLLAVGGAPAGAAAKVKCPLSALKSATKPVEITMWHSAVEQNLKTLQSLTDEFNSSQSDVKVKLVSQIDYKETFTKYKAGLSSGDLPDIAFIQADDQQQMVDTQTVLPASACAKADKYSFSDFLPRVMSYFTIQDTTYAMPFAVSGPVLYYNKKAFTAAGLDPNKPPATLDEVRAAAEKLKSSGAVTKAGLGLKVEPGFFSHWTAMAGKLFVNPNNGRTARATASAFNSKTGLEVFTWLSGMVKDGLAVTNPDSGANAFDDLLGIGSGSHAMAIDTSASLGTVKAVLGGGGFPNVELGVAPMPGPAGNGGVLVSGGAMFMVNKSAPEKQAASWQYLKFLDSAESQATWAVGTGYVPITKTAAASKTVTAFWAANPEFKVAYDQLLAGKDTPAAAGAVIGTSQLVNDIVRDAENSMFLGGTAPKTALKDAATKATAAMKDYNTRIGA